MDTFKTFLENIDIDNNTRSNILHAYQSELNTTEEIEYDGSGFYIICPATKRILLGYRTEDEQWANFGGKRDENEMDPLSTAIRELNEEIRLDTSMYKICTVDPIITNENGFKFYNLFATVEQELIPHLNEEHTGYKWLSLRELAEYNLLPGVRTALSNPINVQIFLDIMDGKYV